MYYTVFNPFNTDLLQCTMQILFKTTQLNVVSEVFIEFKNSLLFFFKWDKYVPTVLNFGMNFSQRTLWYCDAISWDIYVPTGLKGFNIYFFTGLFN